MQLVEGESAQAVSALTVLKFVPGSRELRRGYERDHQGHTVVAMRPIAVALGSTEGKLDGGRLMSWQCIPVHPRVSVSLGTSHCM